MTTAAIICLTTLTAADSSAFIRTWDMQITATHRGLDIQGRCVLDVPVSQRYIHLAFPADARQLTVNSDTLTDIQTTDTVVTVVDPKCGIHNIDFNCFTPWQPTLTLIAIQQSYPLDALTVSVTPPDIQLDIIGLQELFPRPDSRSFVAKSLPANTAAVLAFDSPRPPAIDKIARATVVGSIIIVAFLLGVAVGVRKPPADDRC